MGTDKFGMDKENAKARRSPGDSQPLLLHNQGMSSRQVRPIALRDAELAVNWLNAAKQAKANVSYNAVVSTRQELDELLALTDALQKESAALDWQRVCEAKGKDQAMLKSEMEAHAAKYGELYSKAERRFDALNQTLRKYVFRPGATYLVARHTWHLGMMSDLRGFRLTVGDRLISEGDAVMALVRLASNRAIGTVWLCTKCQQVWLVARRINFDRFCSDECRNAFHTDDDEYRKRKAESQRRERHSTR